jgi:predicted P-loop ATPase
MLAVDFDGDNLSVGDVQAAAVDFFGSAAIGCAYSTASSAPDARRWRLFLPLATPVTPDVWLRILRGFALYLTEFGITVDATAERASQVHFLPNVPNFITDKTGREIPTRNPLTGEPLHFEHEFWGTAVFNPAELTDTATQSLADLDVKDQATEGLRQQQAAEAAQKKVVRDALRQQQLAAGGDGLTPIEKFNLEHDTASLLLEYGYVQDPRAPENWRSPLQTSGTFATQLRDDGTWFSLSGSDKDAGLGNRQRDGVGGDAFDLLVHYAHGGNRAKAVASVANQAAVGAFTGVAAPEGVRPFGAGGGAMTPHNGGLWNPHPHGLTSDGSGKGFSATKSNIEKALLADDFCHRVAWDRFKCQTMVAEPGDTKWRALRESDFWNVSTCLERAGFRAIPKELIRDGLHAAAEKQSFDSAQDWLNGLQWDGVPRLHQFLEIGFGGEAGAYTEAIGKYLFTGMAGRILSPGIKADMAVVAVGGQGTGKSTGIAAIAPEPDAFGGLDLSLQGPDLYRLMRGKLIMELPELVGITRKSLERLKAFLSTPLDEWTEKYQSTRTNNARRCLFFGTTNRTDFLHDPSGERRWLPFDVVAAGDVGWIVANRDQLWAEGRELFKAHGVLWADAQRLAAGVHANYTASDTWDDTLNAWLTTTVFDALPPGGSPFSLADALSKALGIPPAQQNRSAQMRASASLKRLGYERKQRTVEGSLRWVYVRPT